MNMIKEDTFWKRYPVYKDSGVEWIGEIPEEWNSEMGKWLFQMKRTITS